MDGGRKTSLLFHMKDIFFHIFCKQCRQKEEQLLVISDYHWFQSDQAKSGDARCRNLLGMGNCDRAHEEVHANGMTVVKDTTALLLLTADVPVQISCQ